MADIRWMIRGAEVVKDATDLDTFGPNVGVISQALIDAKREEWGLPPQAPDVAIMARLHLIDNRPQA